MLLFKKSTNEVSTMSPVETFWTLFNIATGVIALFSVISEHTEDKKNGSKIRKFTKPVFNALAYRFNDLKK
jgi:hypothetical protein